MSNTARLIYEGPNKILPKISFELSKFRQLAIPMFFSQLAGHATGIIAALMTATAVYLSATESDQIIVESLGSNIGNAIDSNDTV